VLAQVLGGAISLRVADPLRHRVGHRVSMSP
jgi:hypothetical protein